MFKEVLMILTILQFDRYKHTKHPEELKNLKQFKLEQLLIASIDQFGLVKSENISLKLCKPCRYIPGVRVVRPWMMVIILLGILGSWYLGGLLMSAIYTFLFS